MAVDLLLGLQWGDEGKGKIVDVLTTSYDIIARFQGGPNAGHTLEFEGNKHVLHTIPSGIFHPKAINLIGNGVVIDPIIFKKEIDNLAPYKIDFTDKLLISKKAHLILPTHRLLDAASEAAKGKAKIGSTLKGIGPTYMDKTGRNGIRVGDILAVNWEERYQRLTKKHLGILESYDAKVEYDLKSMENAFFESIAALRTFRLVDSEQYLIEAQKAGKKILAEGAQGSLLDVDFGTYPFVTSSTTTAAGACTGLGVAPNKIKEVYGIFKAYTTRVGSGPFPTELFDEDGEKMGRIGNEFGATTGRSRRCGWIDLVALKYSIHINGVTQLMMMKGDVLSGFKNIKVCVSYNTPEGKMDYFPYDISSGIEPIYEELPGWTEDLTKMTFPDEFPSNFQHYIDYLEKALETPIKIVSVGPDRKQTIFR
ncbi:adenylosuccinate synthase [Flavobacteriaceae bacterium]|jgi:adenylosuccinate synthase|nr:adenylosuccinate synthase [Flavobacteriaceae bacterium]MDB4062974.1 adenylosuccinate synthase [Flavobacteriaceae bacterium]MDC0001227.1 adenylosuccinate synthase [Flavobacteriaceae bacterium]MDC1392309.1 adenylosuccinate synthase [Flavobacteriaceae bacterium]